MTLWGEGSPDEEEIKLFFSLIVEDKVEPVRLLLDENKCGALSLDVCHMTGMTPLTAAAYYGAMDVARFLLARGARVDAKDFREHTPLMGAALSGHAEIVALLLENGADPQLVNLRNQTAVFLAAHKGNAACVDLLLKAGADPYVRDYYGQSAFDTAWDRGKKEALAVLEAWQARRDQKELHARNIGRLDKMNLPRRKSGPHES